ncbi:hypothetical protein [Sandaracinobacteroides hominis]|uniref:hypothetical protein n=1 Tax=Sandaracinobacteroides hominis TaxID=2780086 RepID=UPI002E2B87D4|nr:hypothetical protein [Sandaracinobacteroides hominis]
MYAIETCLRLTNIPPSRFGRESVRDPRLVHDMRRGREPGRKVEQRVRLHIDTVMSQLPERGGQRASRRNSF